MDHLLLQLYCNDNCNVRSHKKRHKESTVCWQVITLYLLFVLYKGLMMDGFNPKHVAKACEREFKLCFNWWFIPFLLSFCLLYIGYSCPSWQCVILFRFSHGLSGCSSPCLSSNTFQNFAGTSDLLSEVSKFHHNVKLCSECSTSLRCLKQKMLRKGN